jgi:predicted ArsR family transcriptional regulator
LHYGDRYNTGVERGSPTPTELSPGEFSAAVTAITSAFGDPTRRAIYLFAHESNRGVTASQVADRFRLHPNVARHHLDKLAAGGYLEVAVERAERGGAGRPSKCYRSLGDSVAIEVPVRTDDLVLTLLGRALAALPPAIAQTMAEDVGVEYGRAMAAGLAPGETGGTGQRSFRAALHAVADALTAHGFAAHTDKHNGQLRIINNNCPFGDTAIEHPVICAVDRGMVKGMLGALYGDTEPERTASLPRGDRVCVTEFEPTP